MRSTVLGRKRNLTTSGHCDGPCNMLTCGLSLFVSAGCKGHKETTHSRKFI
jgi:hypothetical protein